MKGLVNPTALAQPPLLTHNTKALSLNIWHQVSLSVSLVQEDLSSRNKPKENEAYMIVQEVPEERSHELGSLGQQTGA